MLFFFYFSWMALSCDSYLNSVNIPYQITFCWRINCKYAQIKDKISEEKKHLILEKKIDINRIRKNLNMNVLERFLENITNRAFQFDDFSFTDFYHSFSL
jgi:hypothetical protein